MPLKRTYSILIYFKAGIIFDVIRGEMAFFNW
jgi:hypothetical protein